MKLDSPTLPLVAEKMGIRTPSPFPKSILMSFESPGTTVGTVAKLAMRQPFVLFKGLTFQKLCLPGVFRPGDHH
ncbi:hypothetical protein ACTMJF_23585, partial [Escherichia coli]|uniref:hypothetical protein n=1 Tax=Escherichia coli TaxID=562 RepID=UPI003F8BE74E